MRNLFLFIWRHQYPTLFILLQVIGLLLLSNSLSYQRSLKFHTLNGISGGVFSGAQSISSYFGLVNENQVLLEENTRLRNQLALTAVPKDSTDKKDTLFSFIAATVISNSVSHQNNFIMVDKGSVDGVEKEMGVVSSGGLAGIVIGVSPHYSLIMSMLHHNMKISARVKKNNQLVNVTWEQHDPLFGTVIDIPSHLQLDEGDTIITSGNSLIFPKDILIGTIHNHTQKPGEHLGSATMRFSTDFGQLGHVYIIRNHRLEEQQLLNEIPEQP